MDENETSPGGWRLRLAAGISGAIAATAMLASVSNLMAYAAKGHAHAVTVPFGGPDLPIGAWAFVAGLDGLTLVCALGVHDHRRRADPFVLSVLVAATGASAVLQYVAAGPTVEDKIVATAPVLMAAIAIAVTVRLVAAARATATATADQAGAETLVALEAEERRLSEALAMFIATGPAVRRAGEVTMVQLSYEAERIEADRAREVAAAARAAGEERAGEVSVQLAEARRQADAARADARVQTEARQLAERARVHADQERARVQAEADQMAAELAACTRPPAPADDRARVHSEPERARVADLDAVLDEGALDHLDSIGILKPGERERMAAVTAAITELTAALGRPPTGTELGEGLGRDGSTGRRWATRYLDLTATARDHGAVA
jgi:hypothetical protein